MRPILHFILVILAGAGLGLLAVYILPSCSSTMPSYVRVRHPAAASSALGATPASMTDAACLKLMEQRDDGELAGKILAGVGGLSALAAAPESFPEGARWGIGAGAATTAVVGVGVLWWGERKGGEFERYCEVTEMAPSPFDGDAGVP